MWEKPHTFSSRSVVRKNSSGSLGQILGNNKDFLSISESLSPPRPHHSGPDSEDFRKRTVVDAVTCYPDATFWIEVLTSPAAVRTAGPQPSTISLLPQDCHWLKRDASPKIMPPFWGSPASSGWLISGYKGPAPSPQLGTTL